MVQDNPVSKFTIYGLYDRVSIPGKKRNFFFATTLKPNTGTHPASTQRRPEALPRGPTSLNMNLPFISEVQNVWILTSAFPTPIHGMVVRQICMPYFLFIFHFIQLHFLNCTFWESSNCPFMTNYHNFPGGTEQITKTLRPRTGQQT